jgi:hypothetical protein
VDDVLVGGRISGPWTLRESLDPERSSVLIWAEGGGCVKVDKAVVAETTSRVVIAVLVDVERAKGVVCTTDLTFTPMVVELARPLGERSVVHAYVAPDLGG